MTAVNPLDDLTLPERLRVIRAQRRMGLNEASFAARAFLPEGTTMSREIVRRLEAGVIPEDRVNPLHVLALARAYQVDPMWLAPEQMDRLRVKADELQALVATAGGSPQARHVDSDTGGPSDKDKSWNRWSPDTAGSAPAA